MDCPLISIAIPFYNNELTILDAVRSVFAQSYKNWELILLDDGSTDNSLAIVKMINDKRVRIVSDGINRGLVYRLNQVPSLVNGEYLARMDADDLMHPNRLKKQIDLLLSENDIDLVDTGTYSIDENGNPVGVRGLEPISSKPEEIIKKAMLLHASILGKKEWFESNPYNPEFVRAEDYELWCRTYTFSNFRRIREPLYIVREGRVNVKNYIQSMKTVNKIFNLYGPNVLNEKSLRTEIFKTHLKIFLYRIFGIFNIHHLLSKRRNQRLNTEQTKEILEALLIIKKVDFIKTNDV
jgi:glycosyltransferase involved in cell wall biosynthesis